jgi:hypothetical protein
MGILRRRKISQFCGLYWSEYRCSSAYNKLKLLNTEMRTVQRQMECLEFLLFSVAIVFFSCICASRKLSGK